MLIIRTRNLNQLKQVISSLPRNLRGMATKEAGKYFVGSPAHGLRHYPPPRAGQKYVRTYKLRYGWHVSDEVGVKAVVANNVVYAPYVQGDNDQAWMHAGRWRTVSKVIADNMAGAIRAVYQAWERWIKQKGLS